MNMVFQAFSIGSNFWLSIWSDDEEHSQERKGLYLGVYGALGVGQGKTAVFFCLQNFYNICMILRINTN